MSRTLITTSKFLSLVLRHHPERIGIQLDEHGWADLDELIAAARRAGRPLTRQLVLRVVRENDKQRFAISQDGRRIRASQGHSIEVDLQLEPVAPPPHLYHGTVARFLPSIAESGLQPGSRQQVHLSGDVTTAKAVGSRRGRAVVLTVRAAEMAVAGFTFYRSANGVWLTSQVPVQYIEFP